MLASQVRQHVRHRILVFVRSRANVTCSRNNTLRPCVLARLLFVEGTIREDMPAPLSLACALARADAEESRELFPELVD
jgi:hypothetical protein